MKLSTVKQALKFASFFTAITFLIIGVCFSFPGVHMNFWNHLSVLFVFFAGIMIVGGSQLTGMANLIAGLSVNWVVMNPMMPYPTTHWFGFVLVLIGGFIGSGAAVFNDGKKEFAHE